MSSEPGFVVIGRNEGQRLVACLRSLPRDGNVVVYVDSGSQDGSVERATALGARVEVLDAARPFTAARARNAGVERLLREAPSLELVQLVDGDCELRPGWLESARAALAARPDVAVVCGRRRERRPEASVYNRLADLEWDTPAGEAAACGGDALVRTDAFRSVGGFREELIAGEEPELCLRLRRAGWRVLRIDAEMTLHDAALLRLGQWWRRQVRSGHADAELAHLHGAGGERFRRREVASSLAWGGGLPAAALGAAAMASPAAAAVLLGLGYGTLGLRIYRARRRRSPAADAAFYALGCVAQKWPALQGVLTYHWSRVRRRRTPLLEYKRPDPADPSAG